MDLVLRGVVIGVSSVIALFAFFYILSWHDGLHPVWLTPA